MGSELEKPTTRRCPICEYVSMTMIEDGRDFYFLCKNFECNVDRIYGDNAVMLRADENIIIRPVKGKVREIL